jgi:hypothetical protein
MISLGIVTAIDHGIGITSRYLREKHQPINLIIFLHPTGSSPQSQRLFILIAIEINTLLRSLHIVGQLTLGEHQQAIRRLRRIRLGKLHHITRVHLQPANLAVFAPVHQDLVLVDGLGD